MLKITVMKNDAGQQFTNLLAMTCFLFLSFFWGGRGGGVTLTDEGLDSLERGGKERNTWWWKQTTVPIMKVNRICNMYQKYIALYMNN